MIRKMLGAAAALAFLGASAGCVPLSEHRKLEERLKEQDKYVQAHKDEVKEFERREQLLTLQAREREKQVELLRTRLEKSERLRAEVEKGLRGGTTSFASTPQQQPAPVMSGFRINPGTGGIVLEHDILFAKGKADLKTEGKKALDEIASKLNGVEFRTYVVRVDGHTDSDPVSKSKATNVDNWGLSANRALVVLRYLETKGVGADRLFCAGFGSQRPMDGSLPPIETKVEKATTKTDSHGKKHKSTKIQPKHVEKRQYTLNDAGKAQNRRVEIVLFDRTK